MTSSYTPSINIIRDLDREFNYIPTPNAHRIFNQIISDFNVGIHSFNIIGSYGTGKSAFLLAFEKTLNDDNRYFGEIDGQLNGLNSFEFLNFVGNYDSIIKTFSDSLGVNDAASSNHRILDKLDEHYKKYAAKNTLLVIVIDEFGKFLEYAAKNDPESELYFIQQLAEYANDKNCIRASSRTQGRFIKRSVKNGKR